MFENVRCENKLQTTISLRLITITKSPINKLMYNKLSKSKTLNLTTSSQSSSLSSLSSRFSSWARNISNLSNASTAYIHNNQHRTKHRVYSLHKTTTDWIYIRLLQAEWNKQKSKQMESTTKKSIRLPSLSSLCSLKYSTACPTYLVVTGPLLLLGDHFKLRPLFFLSPIQLRMCLNA